MTIDEIKQKKNQREEYNLMVDRWQNQEEAVQFALFRPMSMRGYV